MKAEKIEIIISEEVIDALGVSLPLKIYKGKEMVMIESQTWDSLYSCYIPRFGLYALCISSKGYPLFEVVKEKGFPGIKCVGFDQGRITLLFNEGIRVRGNTTWTDVEGGQQ